MRRASRGWSGPGRRRRRWRWAAIAALGALALWVGAAWARGSVAPHLVRFSLAGEGLVEDVVHARALIARAERVVASPSAGTLYALANEGERVRAGAVLAEVQSDEERPRVEGRLAEAESAIRGLEAAEGVQARAAAEEEAAAAAEVSRCAMAWRQAADQGRVGDLPELRRALEAAMRRRARHEATVASYQSRRDALEVERQGLQRTLSQPMCLVEAPCAGAVSFLIDGLEEALAPGGLLELSAGEAADLAGRAAAAAAGWSAGQPAGAGGAGLRVASGDPLLKVVDTMETYIIVCLPSERAEELAARPRLWVKRPDSAAAEAVPASARGLGREGDGQRPLVLVAQDPLLEVAPARCNDVDIVAGRWYGVVVPERALTTRGGRRGVFITYKASLRFVPVAVLGAAAGVAAVEGIEPNVQVVVNPYLAWEGMPIP